MFVQQLSIIISSWILLGGGDFTLVIKHEATEDSTGICLECKWALILQDMFW